MYVISLSTKVSRAHCEGVDWKAKHFKCATNCVWNLESRKVEWSSDGSLWDTTGLEGFRLDRIVEPVNG